MSFIKVVLEGIAASNIDQNALALKRSEQQCNNSSAMQIVVTALKHGLMLQLIEKQIGLFLHTEYIACLALSYFVVADSPPAVLSSFLFTFVSGNVGLRRARRS
jgi:hypothetical protein